MIAGTSATGSGAGALWSRREHVPQVLEDAPAFGTFGRMALEPHPSPGREVGLEVGGQVGRRPPMIAAEAQLVPEGSSTL